MTLKYTKMERNWVMYDVGNSALVLLNTAVVPIYFNAINTGAHPAELVTAWANAQTVASLVVALLMPILGSLADYAGAAVLGGVCAVHHRPQLVDDVLRRHAHRRHHR